MDFIEVVDEDILEDFLLLAQTEKRANEDDIGLTSKKIKI